MLYTLNRRQNGDDGFNTHSDIIPSTDLIQDHHKKDRGTAIRQGHDDMCVKASHPDKVFRTFEKLPRERGM
jgi:hypothetical protein